ncbi:MAG: hypothetical protein QM761_09800 [Pseudoxanthomonas sp.]
MEFSLRVANQTPNLAAIGRKLSAVDPSALFDLAADGRAVRISTMATRQELLDCLRAAGVNAIAADDIIQLPSVCCGGCGG